MTDSGNSALERRIARLEEGLFFQERLLEDLNAALAGQQRQLDAMERTLAETRALAEDLRLLLEAGGGTGNAPPPHYLEK